MSEKIGKFVIIKQLGNGVSGNVVAVKDPSNGDVYAVKSIFSGIDHSSVLKEVEVMLKFNDPFLLKYYFILPEGEITRIFMEYCENGDLEQYLKKNGFVIDEAKLLKIFAQVVKGVSILHENKVIHCDLKPQNILLDGEEVVKLADFGVSKFRNGTLTMIGGKINTTGTSVQGTHGFIPAEVILGAPQSVLSDVFAVGCTMYFVATGRLPFEAATPLAVPVKVVEGTFTPIGRTDLSAEVKDLIHRMLDKDPKKRPTIAELNAHPRLKAALPALPIARRPPPPSTLLGNRATANSAAGTGTGTGTGTGAGSGAAAGGSGGSGNADTGKCSVCGCERAADEPEMACTKGHVCCLVCLVRAAMAAVRAKESTVRCVQAQAGGGCDSSYAQAVLEEQLPHSLLVRLPPPPTETVNLQWSEVHRAKDILLSDGGRTAFHTLVDRLNNDRVVSIAAVLGERKFTAGTILVTMKIDYPRVRNGMGEYFTYYNIGDGYEEEKLRNHLHEYDIFFGGFPTLPTNFSSFSNDIKNTGLFYSQKNKGIYDPQEGKYKKSMDRLFRLGNTVTIVVDIVRGDLTFYTNNFRSDGVKNPTMLLGGVRNNTLVKSGVYLVGGMQQGYFNMFPKWTIESVDLTK